MPISVNASILHASDPLAVQKYLRILEKHQIDPRYTEIELTETATVERSMKARGAGSGSCAKRESIRPWMISEPVILC